MDGISRKNSPWIDPWHDLLSELTRGVTLILPFVHIHSTLQPLVISFVFIKWSGVRILQENSISALQSLIYCTTSKYYACILRSILHCASWIRPSARNIHGFFVHPKTEWLKPRIFNNEINTAVAKLKGLHIPLNYEPEMIVTRMITLILARVA